MVSVPGQEISNTLPPKIAHAGAWNCAVRIAAVYRITPVRRLVGEGKTLDHGG